MVLLSKNAGLWPRSALLLLLDLDNLFQKVDNPVRHMDHGATFRGPFSAMYHRQYHGIAFTTRRDQSVREFKI